MKRQTELERLYPFLLSMRLDLGAFGLREGVRLGEIASKVQHLREVPLMPATAEEMRLLALAKGVHGTTAIEGNTLGLEQVRRSLDEDLNLPKSRRYLEIEVENATRVLSGQFFAAVNGEPLDLAWIQTINRQFLADLETEGHVEPGEWRTTSVGVGDYTAPPASFVPELMERFVTFLNDPNPVPVDDDLWLPIEILRAILSHLYFAWIHPFGDGNGRTARAIELRLLARAGLPVVAAHLLSNHYNVTRTMYYRRLSGARNPKGGMEAFVDYAIEGLLDGVREQLALVWRQNHALAYRDYARSMLEGSGARNLPRLEGLTTLLSTSAMPLSPEEIQDVLETLYAERTLFTVRRDLNRLIQTGLARKTGDRYSADFTGVLAHQGGNLTFDGVIASKGTGV